MLLEFRKITIKSKNHKVHPFKCQIEQTTILSYKTTLNGQKLKNYVLAPKFCKIANLPQKLENYQTTTQTFQTSQTSHISNKFSHMKTKNTKMPLYFEKLQNYPPKLKASIHIILNHNQHAK